MDDAPKKTNLDPATEKMLRKLYLEPESEASFTSANKLFKAARKKNKTITLETINLFLKKIRAYYRHMPAKRHFKREKIYVTNVNEILGLDLADFPKHKDQNDNLRYMLVGVDLFSRKAYCHMMENKTCPETIKALKSIFKKKIPYRSIFSDMGGEFKCAELKKYLKEQNVHIYYARNYAKVSIVERFIRTLRMKIRRYMDQMKTERYIDDLPKIIKSYNRTYHSTIKTSPDSVTTENADEIYQQQYAPNWGKEAKQKKDQRDSKKPAYQKEEQKRKRRFEQVQENKEERRKDSNADALIQKEADSKKPAYQQTENERHKHFSDVKKGKKDKPLPYKFNVGDLVRVSDYQKERYTKEADHKNWTEEIFKIISRQRRDGIIPVYKVEDLKGEEISGTWYTEELKEALLLPNNKILDPDWNITKSKKKGKTLYTVKFLGWPKTFNEQVTKKELDELSERSAGGKKK